MKQLETTEAVAVLRDTSTGDCFLVNTGSVDNLDVERLDESWLELAGWLRYPLQASTEPDTDEESEAPYFTTCMYESDGADQCNRLILIIDDMAPEFCTEHEEAAV